MTLTPEQSSLVASWIAAGDSLSDVQKKIQEQFGLSLTYMDVRFLVDDLDLTLKDKPEPKGDASDVSKPLPPAAKAAGGASQTEGEGEADAVGAGGLVVEVDNVSLIPGAIASGTVTFSDGVTGKWIVDNTGRPGFTEVSQPGYRPSAEDSQEFITQLSAALQQKGF